MDPNYQLPGPRPVMQPPAQSQPHNPYGFILESPNKKRSNPLKPNNSSMTSRILFVVGGLFALIILFSVASSLLSSGSRKATQQLAGIVAQQQEIIRISDLGVKGSSDPAVVSYAQTTKLTIQSQQNKLIPYLVARKVKVTPVVLAGRKNSKTDAALNAATASNSFDKVFTDTIKAELTAYATSVSNGYNTASSKNGKAMFDDFYRNTNTLLK